MPKTLDWVTALLAVLLVVGVLVMLIIGVAVPPELWAGFGLVLGYFFGHQSGANGATVTALLAAGGSGTKKQERAP